MISKLFPGFVRKLLLNRARTIQISIATVVFLFRQRVEILQNVRLYKIHFRSKTCRYSNSEVNRNFTKADYFIFLCGIIEQQQLRT